MNLQEDKYTRYALVREMMDSISLIKEFDPAQTQQVAGQIGEVGRLMLTGEGSSRIFPAKNAIRTALMRGSQTTILTDGSWQCAQYDLTRFAVFCASNSGKTKEVVMLARKLAESTPHRFGLCAHRGTPLEQACSRTFILNCGAENAVAATKSVLEQALFYHSIVWHLCGGKPGGWQEELADQIQFSLTMPIDPAIIRAAAKATTLYFAGYNDGVAEELTLKTNEITRKKADFLEGTYAVHGIEEVLDREDVVFVIDPLEQEVEKFQQVLEQGVGLTVVAIAAKKTAFPTILVPEAGEMNPYLFLCAGWNVLVEIGLSLGINLDQPTRARKVGNELAS